MASNNLAQYFQQQEQNSPTTGCGSYNKHSKAVDAEDDEHFNDTTFQLKRTRSVGLLDEFIAPTKKLIDQDNEAKGAGFDDNDSDENQFIENIEEEPPKLMKPTTVNPVYYDEEEHNENKNDDDDHDEDNKESFNDENSPSTTPDHFQPHDDNDIEYEPSKHVDYLSYNWKEADLSKSWRYIVLKRKDVANSARLENASWRTWAQAKYHLKTISPESVNWLKESDVTWLYGPLYKEPSHNTGAATKSYGSDIETLSTNSSVKLKSKKKKPKGPKPILKKRTVTEMLSQSLPHLVHNNAHAASPPKIEDNFDLISKKVNSQYSAPNMSGSTAPHAITTTVDTPPTTAERAKRHIHFNDRVEQCISVDIPDSDEEEYGNDGHHHDKFGGGSDADDDDDDDDENDNDSDDDDDDEGGFFLMVKPPSATQLHNNNLTKLETSAHDEDTDDEDTESEITQNSLKKTFQIIEPLPATTLKNCSDDDEEPNYALSHNTNTSRGYNYHYDYNSVFIGDSDQCNDLLNANGYEYKDAEPHLEGVPMIDVPDDIVLGSNVEIVDAPQFIHDKQSQFIDPNIRLGNNSVGSPHQTQAPSLPEPGQQLPSPKSEGLVRNRSSSNFQFNNSDADSDSDEEIVSQPFNSTIVSNPSAAASQGSKSSNFNDSLNKVSSSPSYASLSDVAAQGYFAPVPKSSSNNSNLSNVLSGASSTVGSPVNELEKEFNRSSIIQDDSSDNEEGDDQNKGKGFEFLKNWKK